MIYFKGKLGEGHVKRHKYNISTKDGMLLVEAYNWSSIVKKGTVLVMCMIMEKLALADGIDREHRNTCPHCNEILVSWQMKGGSTGKNYHC